MSNTLCNTIGNNLDTFIMAFFLSMSIYDGESEQFIQPQSQNDSFLLSEDQKNGINKRLPRGFMLVKDPPKNKSAITIDYFPQPREIRVASQQLYEQFKLNPVISAAMAPTRRDSSLKNDYLGLNDKAGLRFSQIPEGKSKQGEKIKGILQKFRKLNKFSILAQHWQKIGIMQGFLEIEAQNKKNLHTIDSFKDRCMFIFEQTKTVTSEESILLLIGEMIEEFLYFVEQARKTEFQTNLFNIQKQINEVTREITDIRESGNFYVRKKKRNEKNYDEGQLLHIAKLVKELPLCYLVGVWEIIEDKPFGEINESELEINFSQLKMKKIREIEYYVKKKLATCFKSRLRKKEKLEKKKIEKANEMKSKPEAESKQYVGSSFPHLQMPESLEDFYHPNLSYFAESQNQAKNIDDGEVELDHFFIVNQEKLKSIYEIPSYERIPEPVLQEQQIFFEPLVVEDNPPEPEQVVDDANSSDSSMITNEEESQI